MNNYNRIKSSMSKNDHLLQTAIGDDDDDDDDDHDILTRRGLTSRTSRSPSPPMEGVEGGSMKTLGNDDAEEGRGGGGETRLESARRFLWDEEEQEINFILTPNEQREEVRATSSKNKIIFGGNFMVEGMDSMEFNLQDASYLDDPEEHIGNIKQRRRFRHHKINPFVRFCIGCYHVFVGCIALFVGCICAPPCRRCLLVLLVLGLIGGGIGKLTSNTHGTTRVVDGGDIDHTVTIHDKTTHGSDRYAAARQMVLHHGLVSPDTLDSANTPHHNALHWIADHDESQIDVGHPHFLSRFVLALFYFSTKGLDSPNDGTAPNELVNWMTYKGVCSWYGVRCQVGTVDENQHGSVDSIEIPGLYIGGTIPMEIHALTDLHRLDLIKNKLVGSIPDNLLSMPNLNSLMLADNHLKGPLPNLIPHSCELETINVENSKLGTM